MPTYSVVVTTYRRPELLRRALASVRAQTDEDLECIVVDDGSGTAASVLPEDDRFHLIALPTNVGEARARQTGVDHARGSILCFLDDDDTWLPERLAALAPYRDRDVVVVAWSAWADDPRPRAGRRLEGWVHDQILDTMTPSLGATAIPRHQFVGFDPAFAANGDVDVWVRQTERSAVTTVSRVLHLVGRHDGVRHGNGTAARARASEQLLERHARYFAAHRRAQAYRQYRAAVLHRQSGDRRRARRWAVRSLATRPTAHALAELVRAAAPDAERLRTGR